MMAAQSKWWWQLKGDGDGEHAAAILQRHHSSDISRWWQILGLIFYLPVEDLV